ncbi:MAG: hypothetical protein ACREEM_22195 [Blastocatellia bacterium]
MPTNYPPCAPGFSKGLTSMSLPERLPDFAELPVKSEYPPHSAWGLFGDEDQIGTLNLLTPERVAAAARLVRRGEVFALNWELELPHPPLFKRAALEHTIHRRRARVTASAPINCRRRQPGRACNFKPATSCCCVRAGSNGTAD